MNLPNLLTCLRVLLTVLFIVCFTQDSLWGKVLALAVFTLAALTDYFDGYLARKHNLITPFGKIMDPIADKFMTLSAFFLFTHTHLIQMWMFIVIAAREIIVTGLRLYAMGKGTALAAEAAGKLKTVLQITVVYLIIIFTILAQLPSGSQGLQGFLSGFFRFNSFLMLAVVFITLWSGISFMWNNKKGIFHVR